MLHPINHQWSKSLGIDADCVCHRCISEKRLVVNGLLLNDVMMILCPTCGNKRCPKASDHDLACTGSNESGQKGSVYE